MDEAAVAGARVLRVAINLLGLPSYHQGGSGFMLASLIRALATRDDVFVAVLGSDELMQETRALHPGAELHAFRRAGGRARRGLQLLGSLREPLRYADGWTPVRPIDLDRYSLVHYPLSFMTAPTHTIASLLTITDVQHLSWPAFFSTEERALRALRWCAAARRADRIVTISEYTRERLVETWRLDPRRIDVVRCAIAPEFRTGRPPPRPRRGEYLLYPAAPRHGKNHGRLIEAFARLAADTDLALVLCGPTHHDWSEVRALATTSPVADRIEILEHLGLEDLRAHYVYARALVFPTLYEGFGLPVIEAMACGTPVAAARVASVPEVAGEHAVLFDPLDVADIERAVRDVIGLSADARERRTAAARLWAARFSTESMLEGMLDAYRRVASSSARSRRSRT